MSWHLLSTYTIHMAPKNNKWLRANIITSSKHWNPAPSKGRCLNPKRGCLVASFSINLAPLWGSRKEHDFQNLHPRSRWLLRKPYVAWKVLKWQAPRWRSYLEMSNLLFFWSWYDIHSYVWANCSDRFPPVGHPKWWFRIRESPQNVLIIEVYEL